MRGAGIYNRPIEFRAWDNIEKAMHYYEPLSSFHGVSSSNGKVNRGDKHARMTWTGDCYEAGVIQDYVLLQYTGFIDVNDVKIFEGDIVMDVRNKEWVAAIEWSQVGFCLNKMGPGDRDLWELYERSRLAVIGNVFQNPEYLDETL